MTPRIAALVPMRHQSERVPGKNYRLFSGRPLYHWIVETLLDCPRVAEVIIDTDSPTIIEDASRQFPSVRIVDRPEHLRAGTIPMNSILLRDVELVSADLYLQTHSTNPLLRAATITDAVERFLAAREHHDSLFSVTRLHTRLWDAQGRPINHDPEVLLRTQDLPVTFEENSCLYLFDAATLRARRNRIGARPLLYELDRIEAWDIDEEADFTIAELLHARRGPRD
jgi:CMP-N-acetylneuraminic acid synthetase